LILPASSFKSVKPCQRFVAQLHLRLAEHIGVAFMAPIAIANFVNAADFVFLGYFQHEVVVFAVVRKILFIKTAHFFQDTSVPATHGTCTVHAENVVAIVLQVPDDAEFRKSAARFIHQFVVADRQRPSGMSLQRRRHGLQSVRQVFVVAVKL
jgi:hypothetical protein